MAQGFIDGLEVVNIQHQQGAIVALASAGNQRLLQVFQHQAPVGQLRQRVVKLQVVDLGFGHFVESEVLQHHQLATAQQCTRDLQRAGLPVGMGDDALLRLHQPVALASLLCQGVPACAYMLAVSRVGVSLEPPSGNVGHGLRVVARNLYESGVAVAEAPIGLHQIHPDGQVLQNGTLLCLIERFSLLDLAAQHPPNQDGQQCRQRGPTCGDGPG